MEKKFEIILIVWGKEFTNFFLNFLIPNYLSENNIPYCSKHYDIKIKIYTSPDDLDLIKSNKNFINLTQFIEAEILSVITDHLQRKINNKHSIKGYCQSLAIKEGIKSKTILLLYNPDTLISDGFIKHCCELTENYKVVKIFEFARCDKNKVAEFLLQNYSHKSSHYIHLTSRELVSLCMKYPHAYTKYLMVNKNQPSTYYWPSVLNWNFENKCIVSKVFHLHPIVIDLRSLNLKKELPEVLMSDDGGLIDFLGYKKNDIYIVSDSDFLIGMECSIEQFISDEQIITKNKLLYIFNWARKRNCSISDIENFLENFIYFKLQDNIDTKKINDMISKDLFLLNVLLFPPILFLKKIKRYFREILIKIPPIKNFVRIGQKS